MKSKSTAVRNRWRKVRNGKLPPVNHNVLIYTNKKRFLIAWVDSGTKEFDDQDWGNPYGENDEWPTHWKELIGPVE